MTRPNSRYPALITLALLAGFALAIGLRLAIGGPGAAQSVSAGLIFAAALTALSLAVKTPALVTRRSIGIGLAGGLALCVPAILARLVHGAGPLPPIHSYLEWSVMVTIVAVAEEYFLRGALFDNAGRWLGPVGAVLIAAVAFALLHVPLYGWHVLPLDLAVGIWLGALKLAARTWTAPALAHTAADLAAWWLH